MKLHRYEIDHILENLDELSIENLQAEPQRITRDCMHIAARRASEHTDFHSEDLGQDVSFSTSSEMILAETLNEMLDAARQAKGNQK